MELSYSIHVKPLTSASQKWRHPLFHSLPSISSSFLLLHCCCCGLPACLAACLHACPPSYVPARLPVCLPAFLRDCLPSRLLACLHAWQLMEPLELCYNSLCASGDQAIADGQLLDFLRQVRCTQHGSHSMGWYDAGQREH